MSAESLEMIDVQDVISGIREGVYIVLSKSGSRKKSPAWDKFGEVFTSGETKKYLGFVQCFGCKYLRRYNGKKDGTNVLLGHVCGGGASTSTADQSLPVELRTLLTPPAEAKNFACDKFVEFVARDLRPAAAVGGEGFLDAVQMAIDVGAQYGRVDARKLTPHPTTVSRAMAGKAKSRRTELAEQLKPVIDRGDCAATTDMWTEKYHNTKYSTLTVHWTDTSGSSWKRRNRVLFTARFPDKSATAANIRRDLITRFEELGFSEKDFSNMTFVTDGGSNIVKALEGFPRLYCVAHNFNRVLVNLLTVKYCDLDLGLSCKQAEETCVKICKTFNNLKGKNQKEIALPTSKNRGSGFQSKVSGMAAVLKRHAEIQNVFSNAKTDQHAKHLFNSLDLITLQQIFDILTVIESKVSKQGPKNGTITSGFSEISEVLQEVEGDQLLVTQLKDLLRGQIGILEANSIIDQCKSIVTHFKRCGLQEQLSRSLKQSVDTRWNSCVVMLQSVYDVFEEVTAILKGRKELSYLNGVSKDKIEDLILFLMPFKNKTDLLQGDQSPTLHNVVPAYFFLLKQTRRSPDDSSVMISNLKEKATHELTSRASVTVTETHKVATFLCPSFRQLPMLSPEERKKVQDTVEQMCGEDDPDGDNPPSPKQPRLEDDFDEWREKEVSTNEVVAYMNARIGDDQDLLEWWRGKASQFPKLSSIARKVLAIPATSASSERVFSVAGHTLSARRSCLKPKTVDDILFLSDSLRNGA